MGTWKVLDSIKTVIKKFSEIKIMFYSQKKIPLVSLVAFNYTNMKTIYTFTK